MVWWVQVTTELVYDWDTSLGRPPFWRVSPSSERLHSQTWLHRFVIISPSIMCLGTVICDVNTIGFVSVYACRVCDALVDLDLGCQLCNRSLGDSTLHETKWTSHVKRRNDTISAYILAPVTLSLSCLDTSWAIIFKALFYASTLWNVKHLSK